MSDGKPGPDLHLIANFRPYRDLDRWSALITCRQIRDCPENTHLANANQRALKSYFEQTLGLAKHMSTRDQLMGQNYRKKNELEVVLRGRTAAELLRSHER